MGTAFTEYRPKSLCILKAETPFLTSTFIRVNMLKINILTILTYSKEHLTFDDGPQNIVLDV